MDLNTVETIVSPTCRTDIPALGGTVAALAGGTWLFSEPQDRLHTLVDLAALNWPNMQIGEAGLTLAATCPVAAIADAVLPAGWTAAPLLRQCCQAYLASFKIWRFATIGGNLCLGLPAGPMISLAAALDGVCVIWTPDGGTRRTPVVEFVTGAGHTTRAADEVLRAVELPATALTGRTAFRKIALSPLGRSGAVLIGRLDADGFVLTVTAATDRPVQLRYRTLPDSYRLEADVAAIPVARWFADPHGAPDWRQAMSVRLAGQIRDELAGPA